EDIDIYGTQISDFGFCKPVDEISSNSNSKNVYGVMPYMAPEILRVKKYTKASDIYSFGIIMNEIISIVPPFNNEPHDYHLALDICRGKRPKIREETPELLKGLIQKCLDANPENRPTSGEVWDKLIIVFVKIMNWKNLRNYHMNLLKQQTQNYLKHTLKQFIQADFSIFQICLNL